MSDNDVAPRPVAASLTLRGALVMAVAFCAQRLNAALAPDIVESIAGALADLVFSIGLIAVGVGRARAQRPLA